MGCMCNFHFPVRSKGSFTIVNIDVLVQRVLGAEGGPRPAYYF